MSIFEKCCQFKEMVDKLKSQNRFFYMREIDPPSAPTGIFKDRKMVMLGSNNYLGLANHPKVIEATLETIRRFGTGACSSRILTGTTSLHAKLERKLADFKGTEDAVVFPSGYMAMMGTITALTGPGDVILSDELNHASIVDGCRLSKAQVRIYRHNDMASLEEELAKCSDYANKLIVTDAVFSMRGTVARLPEIKRLAIGYGAQIMIDDAHGTGVLGAAGRGTPEHFGMEGQIDLVCGTFSKALASVGGFAGATKEAVTYLKLNSRPFIFTASPAPATMATVLACIEVLEMEPELLARLRHNTDFVKNGLKDLGFAFEDTVTPIIPIFIGDDMKTFTMAGELEKEGVMANPIVPPAVPRKSSLIRVSVMASLSRKELEFALDKFRLAGRRARVI
jgi:8-amino-7-oxononanoate synthase